MSHLPDSPSNTGGPPLLENARTVGQVEFLVEGFLDKLTLLAPHDADARNALARLKRKLCDNCT